MWPVTLQSPFGIQCKPYGDGDSRSCADGRLDGLDGRTDGFDRLDGPSKGLFSYFYSKVSYRLFHILCKMLKYYI